MLVIIVII